MTWFASIAFSLMLSPLATGQTHVRHMGSDPIPKETLLPGDPVVIPMARDLGWAVVEATINGEGPYRFVFDTGAPGLLLCEDVAKGMKLAKPAGMEGAHVEVRVAGPGGSGHAATLHQVDSLKLGNAEFRGVRAIAAKLPMPSDIAGVLGMGVVSGAMVTLDYPNQQMRIERGELPPADGKQVLDFTEHDQQHSHPAIQVEVAGRPFEFIIDTGMTGWFRFSREIADSCPLAQEPVPGPPAHSVDRKLETQVARLAGGLRIGDCLFDKPHGMLDSMQLKPLVGGRALDGFAVTLDQRNHRVRFAASNRGPIQLPAFRHLGFKPRRGARGFEAWSMIPDSPAAKAGIKEGDLIISIDERPVADCYSGPAWDQAIKADKVRIRYTPTGETEPREAEVPVMELLPEVTQGTHPPSRHDA